MAAEILLDRQAKRIAERQSPPALLTLDLIRTHYLPAGARTLHRWISAGTFPKPDIALGGKVRWWKRETVESWIAAQTEGGVK